MALLGLSRLGQQVHLWSPYSSYSKVVLCFCKVNEYELENTRVMTLSPTASDEKVNLVRKKYKSWKKYQQFIIMPIGYNK